MGFQVHFPWESYEDWLNERLKPLKATVEELQGLRSGKMYVKYQEKKYQNKGFRTPSGKVEIYSEKLESHGYDPLPVYREPDESPLSTPELAKKYPLVITTGKRTFHYMHSRHRDLPSLKKAHPEPFLEIHPGKAAELGINEGDEVVVESKRGNLTVRTAFSDALDPRVISLVHGWESANANLLTDDMVLDPITGFPPYRAFLAKITHQHGAL